MAEAWVGPGRVGVFAESPLGPDKQFAGRGVGAGSREALECWWRRFAGKP